MKKTNEIKTKKESCKVPKSISLIATAVMIFNRDEEKISFLKEIASGKWQGKNKWFEKLTKADQIHAD